MQMEWLACSRPGEQTSGCLSLPGSLVALCREIQEPQGSECENSHIIPGCESDCSAYMGYASLLGSHWAQVKRAPVLSSSISCSASDSSCLLHRPREFLQRRLQGDWSARRDGQKKARRRKKSFGVGDMKGPATPTGLGSKYHHVLI